MTKTHRLQANLNDLNDDQLREFLFHHYHRIKDLEAARKNDPTIMRLKDELREAEAYFNGENRISVNAVKAARALCEVRGLKFDGIDK